MTDERGTDIVVVGAGASGLIAALSASANGARVVLLEKSDKLGGTAAVSGGIVWAPINHHIAIEDPDDREAALAYFGSIAADEGRADILASFVDNAAAAIRFLEEHTRVRFTPLGAYPDYYIDRPGARPQGGRALDSGLFPYLELGAWRERVLTAETWPLALAETPLGGCADPPSPAIIAARLARDERGFGQALVGALLEGCLAAGVDIRLDRRVAELIVDDRRVVGVRVAGSDEAIRASRAVVLATGGFEWNGELARAFLRGPIQHPASPPGNTGDGLALAMRAGAALANMTNAWWCPTLLTDQCWEGGEPRATPVLIERTLPGSIIVNAAGKRFCNEAVNYSAIAGAFHAFDPNTYRYPNDPAWLLFDHGYKLRSAVASAPAGPDVPAWMTSAPDVAGLAELLGIPAGALAATVERFNANAVDGVDPDFARGESVYDRFYGDRSRAGAFATLAPLDTPPFYAVRLYLGVLGTNGGARTDAIGRVTGHDGERIAGLYAVGNVMAGATGGIYAGAGGTLGPALTFGYLAGRHAATANT